MRAETTAELEYKIEPYGLIKRQANGSIECTSLATQNSYQTHPSTVGFAKLRQMFIVCAYIENIYTLKILLYSIFYVLPLLF